MNPFGKLTGRDLPIVALLAASLGTYLHWPALTNPYRFDNNWRQAAQWISPDRQFFHPDDAMLRFAEFGTSPFANILYKTLALTGHDLIWGKINAILFFAAFVTLAFLVGRAMGGRVMGWAAAILLMFFPNVFSEFGGGFMDGLSASLLCLTVLVIVRKGWVWSIPLLLAQSLTYPMVALQSGVILLIDSLIHDRSRLLGLTEWRRKYLWLAVAAAATALVIAAKYLVGHEFGELATRATMQDLPEFRPGGRSILLPVPSLWSQLEGRLLDRFHLLLFLVGYAYLAKRALRLPRGLPALLLGSMTMYVVADVFLFRFYFPNRYLHFSVPLFLALAGGYWVSEVLTRVRTTRPEASSPGWRRVAPLALAVMVLLTIGAREYDGELKRGLSTMEFDDHGLYAWIRGLPGRPMIAAHPARSSDLPVITGRSVFIMDELSQPYWSAHWELVQERTRAFFTAYYATDPDVIVRFIETYGIDYWVIQQHHFTQSYLERPAKLVAEPFDSWIREELRPRPDALLAGLPQEVLDYSDDLHWGISSAALREWLITL